MQQLERLSTTISARYDAVHSTATESVVTPSDISPTPSTASGPAARSAVHTTPQVATGSARSTNRAAIAAAPVGPAEPILGTTPSSSATSSQNVSQVAPRPTPQPCTGPHARRLPFDEECPICQEGDALSECEASEVVWCRSGCGRSVHKTCLENWRAQCVTNRRRLTCALCRSDWDEHSGCNPCDAVHARRRPVEGDCAICCEGLVEEGSTAASEEGLVWCKSSCGQSVYRECFDSWMRHCVDSGRAATCVSCRASWCEECEC
jgi:hypothetical protein